MYGRPPPSSWQSNPNNPNMAPIPPGSRGGIGAAAASTAGPPSGPHSGPPPGPFSVADGLPPHRSGPPPGYGSAPLAPPPGGGTGSNSVLSSQVDPSTTIFVGSITPGVSNMMLKQLLGFCGTLVNLKRISPAFGFASFDHPEAVIRAIDLLNGLALPPPGVTDSFDKQEKTKRLVVKADEKTKAFVEEYKVNRSSRAAAEDELDNAGKAQIEQFVVQLAASDALSHFADAASASATLVPAHLKDLPPEDVPEEHRSSVLGEIDKFRQASAAREEEKRMRERVLERERLQQAHSASGRPSGPRAAGASNGADPSSSSSTNPQSFTSGAPSFVQSSRDAAEAKSLEDMDPEKADELEYQRSKEVAAKEDERRAAEALAAYTHRERTRLAHWTRVLEDTKLEDSRREKLKAQLIRRSEEWNEDLERSRELFWLDRPRWRHYRNPILRREQDEDAADARAEEEEARKAQQEADKFLARQEEEMRKHLEEQRKAGVLVDGGTNMQPLKLKIGVGAVSKSDATGSALPAPAGSAAAVLGGDEEEDAETKAKRGTAIRVDLGDGLTPEERAAAIQAKRQEILSSLSSLSGSHLFAVQVKWDWVDEASIAEVYRGRVAEAVTEAVGEAVPELVDVVVETIRSHRGAESIQKAVEPVMAEDAAEFTESIWRLLIEESSVASSGLLS